MSAAYTAVIAPTPALSELQRVANFAHTVAVLHPSYTWRGIAVMLMKRKVEAGTAVRVLPLSIIPAQACLMGHGFRRRKNNKLGIPGFNELV